MANPMINGYIDYGNPGLSVGDSILTTENGVTQIVPVIQQNGIYYVDQNRNGVVDKGDFEIDTSDISLYLDIPLGDGESDSAWMEIILFIYASLEDRFARDKRTLNSTIAYDKVRTDDYNKNYASLKEEYDQTMLDYQKALDKSRTLAKWMPFIKIFTLIAAALVGFFTGGVGVALIFIAAGVAFEMIMQHTPLAEELAKLDTAWMVVAIVFIVVVAVALPMLIVQFSSRAIAAATSYLGAYVPAFATNLAARFGTFAASLGLGLSASTQAMLATGVRVSSVMSLVTDGSTQIYSGTLSIKQSKFHLRSENFRADMTGVEGSKEIFQKMILLIYTIVQGFLDDDFATVGLGMDEISSRGESDQLFIRRTRS
ncbi:MAG: hypothetical protein V4629_07265 [Pseudomonadota bacterium]